MRKLILLIVIVTSVLFTTGCAENIQRDSTSFDNSSGKSTVIKVTQLEQINASLQNGPVFLKIGSKWCPSCRSMKPILERMAEKFEGNATIASIDADQNPELAEYFGVEGIPDSCVIVGIENGKYTYIFENGNVSTNRSQARIIGFNDDDEKVFEKVIVLALFQQNQK